MLRTFSILLLLSMIISTAYAYEEISIPVYFTTADNTKKLAGTVRLEETAFGLLITPDLHDMKPGAYQFAVHQHGTCANKALAAGEDFDPAHTHKHLGAYGNGHLGDLPLLYVSEDGTTTFPVVAPRITKLAQIKNRSLVIASNNNEAQENSRVACGIIAEG